MLLYILFLTPAPEEVTIVLTEQVGEIFEMIELTKADDTAAVTRCGRLGLTSGVIYDALHLQAGAEILYTDNLKNFIRLVTQEDKIKIVGVR